MLTTRTSLMLTGLLIMHLYWNEHYSRYYNASVSSTRVIIIYFTSYHWSKCSTTGSYRSAGATNQRDLSCTIGATNQRDLSCTIGATNQRDLSCTIGATNQRDLSCTIGATNQRDLSCTIGARRTTSELYNWS